jgi:ankyrin repeat protein
MHTTWQHRWQDKEPVLRLLGSLLGFVNSVRRSERYSTTMTMDRGWTPLERAIRIANTAELKAMFENHGVNPNLQDDEGLSLLHKAVLYHLEAIVKVLVEKEEVNINIRNKRGRTPLWEAASRADKAIVELLLDINRVDPEARNKIVKLLLASGFHSIPLSMKSHAMPS